MAKVRILVAARHVNGFPRDSVVNTVYFDTDPSLDEDLTPDYGALAQDTAALFAAGRNYPSQVKDITATAYHMGDPIPREPKATRTVVPPSRSGTDGPRELAICLSFYSERNLPSRRGRIYLGPWSTSGLGERPEDALRTWCMGIGAGLANIGGTNVDWCVFSQKNGTYHKVTNYWCDNEWDVVRARGYKGDSRLTATTSE
jgi:hypothetical protein